MQIRQNWNVRTRPRVGDRSGVIRMAFDSARRVAQRVANGSDKVANRPKTSLDDELSGQCGQI